MIIIPIPYKGVIDPYRNQILKLVCIINEYAFSNKYPNTEKTKNKFI